MDFLLVPKSCRPLGQGRGRCGTPRPWEAQRPRAGLDRTDL